MNTVYTDTDIFTLSMCLLFPEIDLLQAISIPFDDPKHVYFAEGLHGFPAFGLRAGSDLRTPHSLLLPQERWYCMLLFYDKENYFNQ